jgi:small subunit ribosomal protein S7
MVDGKKSVAEASFMAPWISLPPRAGKDHLALFEVALDNIRPTVEVKSRRVGGATIRFQ